MEDFSVAVGQGVKSYWVGRNIGTRGICSEVICMYVCMYVCSRVDSYNR